MPRLTHRWLLMLALAGSGSLLSSSARAEDFSFAGRSIRLDAPAGWCRLDPKNEADDQLIQNARRIQDGRNYVVLVFSDCQQLGALHSGNLTGYLATGAILIPLQHGQIAAVPNRSRAGFIDEVTRELGAVDMDQIRDELRGRVADGGAGIDVDGFKSLGVLRKDELGVYPGFLLPAPPQFSVKTLLAINALTMVNGLPVSVVITRPADSAATMDRMLAEEQEILRALIAANAGIEAAAPEPASSFAWDIDWNQVLRTSFIGAMVGGLIGAVGYAMRRWRGQGAGQG